MSTTVTRTYGFRCISSLRLPLAPVISHRHIPLGHEDHLKQSTTRVSVLPHHLLMHRGCRARKPFSASGCLFDLLYTRHSHKRLKQCRHSHPQCYQGSHSSRPLICAVLHMGPGLREWCLRKLIVGRGWNTTVMLRTEFEISASVFDRTEQINDDPAK